MRKFLILIPLFVTMPLYAASLSGEITQYTDGDTLRIWDQKIRLLGIDAPEFSQSCKDKNGKAYSCGVKSLNYLKKLIGKQQVRCEGNETDRYDRLLATCYVRDANINKTLVEQGWAVAFVRYDEVYLPQEKVAQQRKLGIWQGDFQRPKDYRAEGWKAAKASQNKAAAEGCVIKGNINGKGQKIYHTPWGSKNYKRTRINTTYGERWFCDENAAITAGWRAPKR